MHMHITYCHLLQTDRQTDRQTVTQTGRLTDTLTDRLIDVIEATSKDKLLGMH